MLQLEFSEADKQVLHYERYHHPHPRVQQRMEALWLKSQGVFPFSGQEVKREESLS
jgi:hypothetical protein